MPAPTAEFSACIDAFDREFDYVFRLLRRHGVAASEADVRSRKIQAFAPHALIHLYRSFLAMVCGDLN